MKTKGMIVPCLLIAFWLLSSCNSYVNAREKNILIAGDEEKRGGYLVEITKEAFSRVGYYPDFIFIPWARALTKSMDGEYDVLLAAYYTKERAEKMEYTDSIGATRIYFLKRKNQNIHYNNLKNLKPYRIGHIMGSKVNETFDKAEKDFLAIEYVSSTELNIKKLLAGRIDLVVEKEERLRQLLNGEFKADAASLEFLQPPLQVNKFYNCVSKKLPGHRQIVDDFNRGLQVIREDGTLTKILEKHGITLE